MSPLNTSHRQTSAGIVQSREHRSTTPEPTNSSRLPRHGEPRSTTPEPTNSCRLPRHATSRSPAKHLAKHPTQHPARHPATHPVQRPAKHPAARRWHTAEARAHAVCDGGRGAPPPPQWRHPLQEAARAAVPELPQRLLQLPDDRPTRGPPSHRSQLATADPRSAIPPVTVSQTLLGALRWVI